jgi:hypothetical protein
MGEWSRLAADHTEKPEQLTSIKLEDIIVDYGIFARLVTSNYRHFQPASVASWQEEHGRAIEAAVEGSRYDGLVAVRRFEAALAIEAFAQHYLQDSFASGHMGFNRVASSNAAALTYHDANSRRGRCVADQHGALWYTFGDDALCPPYQKEYCRYRELPPYAKRLIDVATASLREVLEAFVRGDVAAVDSENVWDQMPAFSKRDAGRPADCIAGGEWESLRTIQRPAQSVSTVEFLTVVDNSIYQPAPRALVLGISRDFIYTIPIGDRVIQNRIFVAGGATVSEIGRRSYVLGYAYLWHLGTSFRGTVTHELGLGQMLFYLPKGKGYREYRNSSAHILYGMNIEVGRVFLRLLVGPSSSCCGSSGLHASAGVGYVRKAKQ